MNKLFTKIATLSVGLAMAIGVGVAVGSKDIKVANAAAASSSSTAPTNATWSHVMASGDLPVTASGSKTWSSNNVSVTWSTTSGNTSAYAGYDSNKGVQLGSGTSGKAMTSNYTISTAVSSFGSSKRVTKVAIGLSNANSGGYSGSLANGDTISGTATSVTYYTSALFSQTTGNITFTFKSTKTKAIYVKAIYVWYENATTQYSASLASGSNATLSGTTTVDSGSALSVTIVPTTHYHLPAAGSVSCTMGGSAYAGYTYNASTGAFSIASVTGAVVITCPCAEDAKYTVTYVKGDHGSGSNYVVSNQYAGSYTLVSLATAGFSADSGYGFKKWDVGGTEYDPGDSFTLSANTTVTAVWAEVVTLTYDKNGGTGTNASSQVAKGATVTVADNSFTAPTGKDFSKWNTKSDGTGTSYVKDDTFTINADTILYAQWSPVIDITLANWNDENNVVTAITNNYTTTAATSLPVATFNSTSTVSLEGYGVYANSPNIQMNSGKGTYIKNTTALPAGAYITKIITVWGGSSTQQGNAKPKIYMSKGSVASSSSTLVATATGGANQTWTVTNAASCGYNYFYFDGGSNLSGACYLTSMKVCYDFNDEVQSIAVNATQAQLTFTVGDTFTFAGSVTPTRLISGVGSATTSNLTFKLGGTAITVGSYTFVKADNGKTLNVTYTENGKSVNANAPYSVIVNYAYVESVEINTATSELGKLDSFTFGAEVLPSNAQQDVTWSVADKIGTEVEDGNIIIDEDTGELTVTASEGCTITVTVTTVGEDENGDTLTDSVDVVVTGDPVVVVNSALAGYSGKNTNLAYSFSNFTGNLSVVSSDTEKVTVGTPTVTTGTSGNGTVQVNFVAAGSSTLSFKNGDTAVATCTVTVTASAVASVTWSDASDMTVYSGSTALNASKISSWAPQYEMNNGDTGSISSNYTIQLNGSAYTLGSALEAGTYVVTLTYGGQTTASSNPTVTVVQSLNTINAADTYSHAWNSNEDKLSSYATSLTLSGTTWTVGYTWASSASAVQNVDGTKGQQFGTGSNYLTGLTFQTTEISGTISSIVVNTSGASKVSGTITASVGGNAYSTTSNALSSSNTEYTFTGSSASSGTVLLTWANTGAAALYIKSIVVNYSSNVSNVAAHIEAQAKVVEFAQYMNTEMNGSKVCTGDMSNLGDAWDNVADKYDALFGDGKTSLSSAELAYAKKMITSATANWNENHDSDEKYCLERALKTYEWCVSHYPETCTEFMSSVRSVGKITINPLQATAKSTGTMIAIIAISVISLAAVGGYFLFRKKKEQ